jgi:arylsulfatase A-like enzyme
MKDILLISKDVLKTDYLSCYGGNKWETPNIDKLAKIGTIFKNCYTVAPSSAMAYTCMFSGLNAYELKRSSYTKVKPFNQCPTLFDILESKGYENHVIWDEDWYYTALEWSKVYGNDTTFHNLSIGQMVGPHYLKGGKVKPNKHAEPVKKIIKSVKEIFSKKSKPIFLWIHCPHVLDGRAGYGQDIDLFDELVGSLTDFFDTQNIYLTADHGHMDCDKGIPVYGFHVYEPAIKIPLITPNHYDNKEIYDLIGNNQIKNIILDHKILPQEFIYSDTQYYLQENRRLMIRKGDFKYIYNKKNKSEELYDLKYDVNESVNLLIENWYDRSRQKNYFLEEIYYYPRWQEARNAYNELKNEKNRIWKQGKVSQELLYRLNFIRKKGMGNFYQFFTRNRKKVKGRWNSVAQRVFFEK